MQQILSNYLILDRIIGLLNCSIIAYFLIKSSSSWLRDQIIISTGPIYTSSTLNHPRFTTLARQKCFFIMFVYQQIIWRACQLYFLSNSKKISIHPFISEHLKILFLIEGNINLSFKTSMGKHQIIENTLILFISLNVLILP